MGAPILSVGAPILSMGAPILSVGAPILSVGAPILSGIPYPLCRSSYPPLWEPLSSLWEPFNGSPYPLPGAPYSLSVGAPILVKFFAWESWIQSFCCVEGVGTEIIILNRVHPPKMYRTVESRGNTMNQVVQGGGRDNINNGGLGPNLWVSLLEYMKVLTFYRPAVSWRDAHDAVKGESAMVIVLFGRLYSFLNLLRKDL